MVEQYRIGEGQDGILPVGMRDANGELHRVVSLHRMTLAMQEKLTDKKYQNNPSGVISALIGSCIAEVPGLIERRETNRTQIAARHLDNMFVADRDYLLVKLLVASHLGEKTCDYSCPKCKTNSTVDINLADLKVTPHDHSKPTNFKFTLKYPLVQKRKNDEPVSFTGGTFWFPTSADFDVVSKSGKSDMGAFESFARLLAQCTIWDRNDDKEPHKLMYQELRFMVESVDVNSLLKKTKEFFPGPELSEEVECWNCGHKFDFGIPLDRFLLSD